MVCNLLIVYLTRQRVRWCRRTVHELYAFDRGGWVGTDESNARGVMGPRRCAISTATRHYEHRAADPVGVPLSRAHATSTSGILGSNPSQRQPGRFCPCLAPATVSGSQEGSGVWIIYLHMPSFYLHTHCNTQFIFTFHLSGTHYLDNYLQQDTI